MPPPNKGPVFENQGFVRVLPFIVFSPLLIDPPADPDPIQNVFNLFLKIERVRQIIKR